MTLSLKIWFVLASSIGLAFLLCSCSTPPRTTATGPSREDVAIRDWLLPHTQPWSPPHTNNPLNTVLTANTPPEPPSIQTAPKAIVESLVLPAHVPVNRASWSNTALTNESAYLTGLSASSEPNGPWTMIYEAPYTTSPVYFETNPPSPRFYKTFNRIK